MNFENWNRNMNQNIKTCLKIYIDALISRTDDVDIQSYEWMSNEAFSWNFFFKDKSLKSLMFVLFKFHDYKLSYGMKE